MAYEISEKCIGCGTCAKKCPVQAISGEKRKQHEIDPILCEECGTCFDICPKGAILDPQGNQRVGQGSFLKKPRLAVVDRTLCAGCQTCFMNCPQEAIDFVRTGLLSSGYSVVDAELCVGCGTCAKFCITGAIELEERS